jgi:hypothetical protein
MDVINYSKIKKVQQDLETHKSAYTSNKERTDLKIATVDKELNDFQKTLSQVNINQEAKQSATGYGMVSLPKNAANGQVSVSVKGETRTNLSVKSKNYTVSLTNASAHNIETIKLYAGKTYCISAYVDNSSSTVGARIRLQDEASVLTGGNDVASGKKDYSNIVITPSVTQNYIIQAQKYSLTPTDVAIFSQILIEETDKRKPFITGTKSTVCASRLKSVGKNLFDGNKVTLSAYIDGVTGILGNSTVSNASDFIKVQPNTNYVKSGFSDTAPRSLVFYDISKNYISSIAIDHIDKAFVTPPNAHYLRLAVPKVDMETVQVEKGTIATPFEPYTESTQYVVAKDSNGNIIEAKSVPSAKDEFRVTEGKSIQRTKKYVLQESHVGLDTSYPNMDRVVIQKPTDYIYYNISGGSSDTSFKASFCDKIAVYSSGWDIVENEYSITAKASTTTFIYFVPKGLYANSAAAQAALAGKSLIYQLATPIEIPIEVSGTLMSYPSGTIYVENAVADAGIYTDKFTILQQDLPIKSIERIAKVDFMTGVETELDVSQAVISTDKLSFTHPNLTTNDIVFTTYFYDKEGTLGETTVTYYDSRHTVKDKTLENKFYQWTIEVDNGTPSIKLVEV